MCGHTLHVYECTQTYICACACACACMYMYTCANYTCICTCMRRSDVLRESVASMHYEHLKTKITRACTYVRRFDNGYFRELVASTHDEHLLKLPSDLALLQVLSSSYPLILRCSVGVFVGVCVWRVGGVGFVWACVCARRIRVCVCVCVRAQSSTGSILKEIKRNMSKERERARAGEREDGTGHAFQRAC
jgi:hypothetical protein